MKSKVGAVIDSMKRRDEQIAGVSYDSMRKKLYWTSGTESNESAKIYRSGIKSDAEVEILLDTSQCEPP